jgi:uncharacterized protein (DUF2235 family)
MPKNIVICCDGTGEEFGLQTDSNVVKLYSTLAIDDSQIGYYHPGVGTMGAPGAHNELDKQWTRLMGLAFGAGLLDNVGDAYRYLMSNWEEDDRIFLFGFSRGAFTVRALAGILYMFGLLHPGNEGLIPYITRMFARHSRREGGMTPTFKVAHAFKQTFSRDCALHFVGVWDTVSSVGWIYDPVVLPYTARNPILQIGRHAVSIDERRCFFRENLWGEPFDGQDIKQVWFAGTHCDVGGGFDEVDSGASKVPLEWMLVEATRAGLQVDPAKADVVFGRVPDATGMAHAKPDAVGPLHESLRRFWWPLEFLPHRYYDRKTGQERWRIPLGARRTIPERPVVHESVQERMKRMDYNPPNLPRQFEVEPWVSLGSGSARPKAANV